MMRIYSIEIVAIGKVNQVCLYTLKFMVDIISEENFALHRFASSSSVTSSSTGASQATDGVINSDAICFKTASGDDFPWWMVDLGRPVLVLAVEVTNRISYSKMM